MVLSLCRIAVGAGIALTIWLEGVPTLAIARELATAQGIVAISDARIGFRAPSCSELVVEARDALDNRLIADTQPTANEAGACAYALSVPAQHAVWLRVQPVLVAGARVVNGLRVNTTGAGRTHPAFGSVALRFTIIAPTTYFFAPGEQKTIPLSY
jgi:hypothetical protein